MVSDNPNGIMPEEWENQEKWGRENEENFIDPKYKEALKRYLEQNKVNATQMTYDDMTRIIKNLKEEI